MALLLSATLGGASVLWPYGHIFFQRGIPRGSIRLGGRVLDRRANGSEPGRTCGDRRAADRCCRPHESDQPDRGAGIRRRRARGTLGRPAAAAAGRRRHRRSDPGGRGAAAWLECVSLRLAVRFWLRLE